MKFRQLLVYLMLGMPCGCGQPKEAEAPYANPSELVAHLFYAEYLRDPTAADAKYKGKKVEVGSAHWEFSDAKKDFVRIWVLNEGEKVVGIRCCFDGPAKWPNHGDSVSFVGACEGMDDGVIILRHCYINGLGGWVE